MNEKQETFTPGPWHAWYCKDNQTGGGIFQDTNTDSQRMICRMAKEKRVIHEDKRKSDDFLHSAEDEANARLIASAPELFEQCKLFEQLLKAIGDMGYKDEIDLDSHSWLMRTMELRKVLAKVEGETA